MAARSGPKKHLTTREVLEAVNVLGSRWTVAFADEEVLSVAGALERELLAGNLLDACTVSAQGLAELARDGGPPNPARIEVGTDARCSQCRLVGTCWTVMCTSCGTLAQRHVDDDRLTAEVQAALTGHACPGPVT